MKTRLLTIILALAGLAACNKQSITAEEEFLLEITQEDEPTKSSSASVDINLANLEFPSSRSLTAQLKKRTGTGWVNVDTGVSYGWSSPSEDNNKYGTSGANGQSCTVTAKAEGSGILNVTAVLDGKTVAQKDIPVTVSDSRALSWTDATTSITKGVIRTATLNSNFSGTATISTDNSLLYVGTESNNLKSSTSVTFSNNKTQTIYYKYTGDDETTINLAATSTSTGKSASFNLQTTTIPQVNISLNVTYELDFQYYDLFLFYGLNNSTSNNRITLFTSVNDEKIPGLTSYANLVTSDYRGKKTSQIKLNVGNTFNVSTYMEGTTDTFWRYQNGVTKYGSVIYGYYEILMGKSRVYKIIDAFEAKPNSGPNGMADNRTLRYMFTLSGELWNLYNSFGDEKPSDITVNVSMTGKPYSI